MLGVPSAQARVRLVVFLGNRVRSNDHLQLVLRSQEVTKGFDMGAGRVANDQAGRQMNDFSAVVLQLRGRIFDVSARTAAARGVANQFHFLALVAAESAFAVPQRADSLAREEVLAGSFRQPIGRDRPSGGRFCPLSGWCRAQRTGCRKACGAGFQKLASFHRRPPSGWDDGLLCIFFSNISQTP